MPQESLGFVRMIWVCPNCQSKNPGNFRFCRGCGAAQPADIQFQKDETDVLVTDAAEIAQAKLGADIHCGFCGARNPANHTDCSSCGADLASGSKRVSGTVTGALQTGPVASVACPTCGAPNPANALNCQGCGAPLAARPTPPASTPAAKLPKWLLPVALIAGLALIILVVVWLTRTSATTGVVSAVNWERTIPVLALQPVRHEDWQANIPSEAEMGTCEDRLYQVADQPSDNSKKICGTPYTVDQGNGYSEVVQDCQYEIYEPYCQYTVMDWAEVDTLVQRGADNSPVWPEQMLASDRRAGEPQASYRIRFDTSDGEKDYSSASLEEFTAALPGSRWNLTVNSFGSVVAIEPAQ